MLSGKVARIGRHYVVEVNATDCQTGDILVRKQVEAESQQGILQAVDKLTRDLRGSLGESLSSIRTFDTPLERATTSSLPALRNYTLGNKELASGSYEQAIRSFERAIQDDPNFAMAYAKMGQAYDNIDESDNATKCVERAFTLRKGLSRYESFYVAARYYELATGDTTRLIAALEDWKEAYPRDWMPHYDLASDYGDYFGRFDQGLREAREAVSLNPERF